MKYHHQLHRMILFCVFLNCLGQLACKQQNSTTELLPYELSFEMLSEKDNLYQAIDSTGNRWIRGHVPFRLLGKTVIFQIPSSHIQYYDLYLRQGEEFRLLPRNTDDEDIGFKSRFPQYKFIPQDSVYHLHVRQDFGSSIPITIQEQNVFSGDESSRLLRIGLYYGLALMSLVFNIVFYLIFRDKKFIAYCVLLLGTFLSFFYEDGMFYYMTNGEWTMDYFIVWNTSFTTMACVAFTYYFLGLERVLRPYLKWYLIASAVLLSFALFYTLTDLPIFSHLSGATCFSFAFFCLYIAIRRFKTDVYARFLTICFGLVALTGLGYILYSRIGSSDLAIFDIGMFRLFNAIEVISISFAIIFKVRALQQENEQYREELNKYVHRLEVQQQVYSTQVHEVSGILKQGDIHSVLQGLREQCNLTDREMEVLTCIQQRLSNQEIADKLYISLSTTKYHIGNLYLKLDVKNRREVHQVLQETFIT